jgi:hypothetical protein
MADVNNVMQALVVAAIVGWCGWRAWRTWVRRPAPAAGLPKTADPACKSGGCDGCSQ